MLNQYHIPDEQMDRLFIEVLDKYGYDFTGYAQASLKRRLLRIFTLDKHLSFAELRYKVLNDPIYFKRFVEQITVNVTEMFRDPSFYKKLRELILPDLSTHPFIKVWLAGCATGEEAYSLAIVLNELSLLHKSLLYATDINPLVLEKAAQATFPLSQMKQYSENYIASGGTKDFSSYYIANNALAKFSRQLREKIIFSTHNLVSDYSFNEFQLVLCRNVLIYFDRCLQFKVFQLFDNSLENGGYLALGTKETVDFSPIAPRYSRLQREKIWKKTNERM